MSKAEILAELPQLSREDLVELSTKLDELLGHEWLDDGELGDFEKAEIESALARLEDGSATTEPWPVVKARLSAKFK